MILAVLWWCFDDHLATALQAPGLGALPLWVVFLAGLGLELSASSWRSQ